MSNTGNEIKYIPINDLMDDLWDARQHDSWNKDKEEQHIKELSEDIGRIGLLNPLNVIPKKNGKYSVVAGRFRLQACKRLGLEKIECRIYPTLDKAKIASATVSENKKRLNLTWNESLNSAIKPFIDNNFTYKEIQTLAKRVHNTGTKGVDSRFLDALESCGYAANTVYQIMQTKLQIKPSVQKKINKANLSLAKRIMLTNSKLREHPELQKRLVDRIRGKSEHKARVEVNQLIRDLETEAVVKHGNTYIIDDSKRERVDGRLIIERTSGEYFLDITEEIENLLYLLTGHKKTHGESFYDSNHVEFTERHRINIAKAMTKRELAKLQNDMDILRDALNSFLHLVHKEKLGRE